MNTFEDAKKAKWIVKHILPKLIESGIKVQFASLFFEDDEDKDFHEKQITLFSESNDFRNLVLFGVSFESEIFYLKLLIGEEDGIWIYLAKYDKNGEEEEEQDTTKQTWREVFIVLSRFLDKDWLKLRNKETTDESIYENLKKLWF